MFDLIRSPRLSSEGWTSALVGDTVQLSVVGVIDGNLSGLLKALSHFSGLSAGLKVKPVFPGLLDLVVLFLFVFGDLEVSWFVLEFLIICIGLRPDPTRLPAEKFRQASH